MRLRMIRIFLALVLLVFASLACNLPSSKSTQSPAAVPMSPEELQSLEDNLKKTVAASSGELTLTLTEQQLNAVLLDKLAEQNDQLISDLVVRLTNGRMEINGKAVQGPISLDLAIILKPEIDPSGSSFLNIEEITIGGLPVPGDTKDKIGSLVDRAMQEYLSSQSQGFKPSKITIDEGKMTVTGSIQQP